MIRVKAFMVGFRRLRFVLRWLLEINHINICNKGCTSTVSFTFEEN